MPLRRADGRGGVEAHAVVFHCELRHAFVIVAEAEGNLRSLGVLERIRDPLLRQEEQIARHIVVKRSLHRRQLNRDGDRHAPTPIPRDLAKCLGKRSLFELGCP